MQTINKLIDEARKVCLRDSDMALAEKLGVARNSVSVWRRGGKITDEHLASLIELAKADPEIALHVREEQASTKAEKRMWHHMLTRLAAAAFLMGMHIMLNAGLTMARFLPRVSTVTKQGAMKCAST